MDRFLTFEGEQPIFLDDFNFMQDAVKDTIRNVVQTMMHSNEATCILSGCELAYNDNGTTSWTDGIVMLEGEILPIKAGTVNVNANNDEPLYFNIIESYAPNGERTFKNGTRHNCYQLRTATISGDSNGGYYIFEIPRLEDYVREEKHLIYSKWESNTKIEAHLLHKFGEGWHLCITLNQKVSPSANIDDIIPDTDVTKLVERGLNTGVTYAIQYYMKGGGVMEMRPITISVNYKEDNRAYLKAFYSDTQSFPVGQAQLYCRLMDN